MVLDPQELWHQGVATELKRFVLSSCDLVSVSRQVWQDALDLTQSGGSGEVHCYFHYTTQVGFQNITAPEKKAVEVFVLP